MREGVQPVCGIGKSHLAKQRDHLGPLPRAQARAEEPHGKDQKAKDKDGAIIDRPSRRIPT